MEKRRKYLECLSANDAQQLLTLIDLITAQKLETLDIKPFVGKKGRRRYRKGKWRVVFEVTSEEVIIHAVGPRGDIYKDM